MKPLFHLDPGQWYQLTVIDGGEPMDSPIRVNEVQRRPRGKLRLGFYHAHYPEGVRDKVYDLRITEESVSGLVAKALDQEGRCIHIRPLRGDPPQAT